MQKAVIIDNLIKEKGYNLKTFAEKCGMPYSTLYTMIKKTGVSRATVDNVILICKGLGITVEELDELSRGEYHKTQEPVYDDLHGLIARNGKNLSLEEKKELIKI